MVLNHIGGIWSHRKNPKSCSQNHLLKWLHFIWKCTFLSKLTTLAKQWEWRYFKIKNYTFDKEVLQFKKHEGIRKISLNHARTKRFAKSALNTIAHTYVKYQWQIWMKDIYIHPCNYKTVVLVDFVSSVK